MIQIRPGHPEPYRNAKGELVTLRGTALITRDLQRTVQNNLAGNNVIPVPNRARDTRAKHLLTGLLQCPGCKRSMSMGGRSYSVPGSHRRYRVPRQGVREDDSH